MKKILFLSFRNNPHGLGGGITTIIEMALLLAKDYDIEIMTPFKIKQINNKQVIFLNSEKRWNDFKISIYLISVLRLLKKLHKHYDKILVFLPNPSLSFIGDLFNVICPGKVIVYFGGIIQEKRIPMSYSKIGFNNKIRLLLNSSFLARLSRKKCIYIVSSNFQKKQLLSLRYKSESIKVIPNLPKSKRYYQNSIMLKNKNRVITYIGHLNYEKGVDILIEAFLEIEKLIENVDLYIVISTNKKNAYTKEIIKKCQMSSRIHLYFKRINTNDLLNRSMMVILPYRTLVGTSMYPSLVLEALKNNALVISTSFPLIEEILPKNTLFKNKKEPINELYNLIKDNLLYTEIYNNNLKRQQIIFNTIFDEIRIKNKLMEVLG